MNLLQPSQKEEALKNYPNQQRQILINQDLSKQYFMFVELFIDICTGCIKCFYFIFCNCMGLLHMALGITAIVLSAIVQRRMNQTFDYFDSYSEPIGQNMMIAMWTLSSFILFCGIIGLICCQKKPLYVFGGTLTYAIFALQLRDQINDMASIMFLTKANNCLSAKWSYNLESAYSWAQREFCQSNCQCYIKDQYLAPYYGINNYTLTPSNVTKVQNCPKINKEKYHQEIDYLSYIENTFKCSGWCQSYKYYLFSDINQLVPQQYQQGCYKLVLNQIAENFNLLAIFSFTVMGIESFVILISCFVTCCLVEAITDVNDALL